MVKVGSRVIEFSLYATVLTLGSLGISKVYGQTEAEKEAILREKYPDLVAQSRTNKAGLTNVLRILKKGGESSSENDTERKLQELLWAGKGKMKRQSNIDTHRNDPKSQSENSKNIKR